jgi:hypothetical protein
MERASGVSEVAVGDHILRCLVCGSFQPFLEALRGHEVVSLSASPVAAHAPEDGPEAISNVGAGGSSVPKPAIKGSWRMNTRSDHMAPGRIARIAGGLYLAYILAMVFADVLGHIGRGTSEQMYQAIVANDGSFRLGLVVGLISAFLFLMTAWGLYVLLRSIDNNLALLFLLLNTVGVAIQCASMLPLVSAMLQGDAASHMQAYSAGQLEGLAYLSINVYKTGFVTAQLFFATWLFPLGYLIYKSRLLPRLLGVLLLLDGIAVLIWFLQVLLLPDYAAIRYPGLAVSFVAEVGLGLWLLVMGAKVADPGAGLPGDMRLTDPQTDGARA